MATFTWTAGTTGDWSVAGDWTLTGGTGTPPPGENSAGLDVAILGTTNAAYTVTINTGDTFDIAELDITGSSANKATSLSISGSLITNKLSYSGSGGDALITVAAGGLLDIQGSLSATFAAQKPQILTIAGDGSGGTLELGSAVNSGIDINDPNVQFNFANAASGPSTGTIEFNGPTFATDSTTNQTITNAAPGDTFVFDHANFSSDTFTYTSAGKSGTLTVSNTTVGTVLTMNNLTGTKLKSENFVGVGDAIQIVVCYARGTMLRTPGGEAPVEKLLAGQQVITLVDGEEVPKVVVWLGHRRINIAGHPSPETVLPIRILSDAFADGMPHRDLLLSPDHAVFVDDQLICARQLVNGTTIRQEHDWAAVDYYHVELDQHSILVAEGLPAESYIDTGNRGFFGNSGAPLVLHPDLTDETDYPTREAGSCVPFVWDEASVRPVWQRLADRAAAIGQPAQEGAITTDTDLRLCSRQPYQLHRKPIYQDSNLAIFVVPRGASEIRLISRAQSPTEARPWLADRRRLGIRAKRIVLRGASELREIPMDHPGLTNGWWDIERDGQMMSRWTNGDAVVPLPAMDGFVVLEIHLAGEMIYVVEAESKRQAA